MKASLVFFSAFFLFSVYCRADDTPQIVKGTSILTPDALKWMTNLVLEKGKKKDIGPDIAAKLGLPFAPCIITAIAIKEQPSGFIHVFGLLPNGDLLFSFLDIQAAHTYRVSSDFAIIACTQLSSNVASNIVDPDQSFSKELQWWASENRITNGIKSQ